MPSRCLLAGEGIHLPPHNLLIKLELQVTRDFATQFCHGPSTYKDRFKGEKKTQQENEILSPFI